MLDKGKIPVNPVRPKRKLTALFSPFLMSSFSTGHGQSASIVQPHPPSELNSELTLIPRLSTRLVASNYFNASARTPIDGDSQDDKIGAMKLDIVQRVRHALLTRAGGPRRLAFCDTFMYPTTSIFCMDEYIRQHIVAAQSQVFVTVAKDANRQVKDTHSELIIMVIGETARADHF